MATVKTMSKKITNTSKRNSDNQTVFRGPFISVTKKTDNS